VSRKHVVGFLLLTSLLILGSLAWSVYRHRAGAPQRRAWSEMADRLRSGKSRIDSLEAEIARGRRRVAVHRAHLDSLEDRIAAFERRAVGGRLPRPQHRAYLRVIEQQNRASEAHNAALAEVQSTYDDYTALIRAHNALVDSANQLRRAAAEEGIRLEDRGLR
jgi:predicted  nucleic acid-binding Zn-ribbon protein